MPRLLLHTIVLAATLVAPMAFAAGPLAPRDTASYQVPEVVVTALRGQDRLRDVPAAGFVISRQRIEQSGVSRVSSLLGTLPGLYGYQQNSSGDVQVVDPRGFTANGESSYLKLLVNGQDVRDVENGDVDWDWLLPHDVERLEVVEGPGTWLYGDGAEGGIVNIVRPELEEGLHSDCGAQLGSFGLIAGSIALSGRREALAGSLRGSARRVRGWRDRSHDRAAGGGADGRWKIDARNGLAITVDWLDALRQDPGALKPDQLAADRAQSDTQTDFTHPRRVNLGSRLTHGDAGATEWTLAPYLRTESASQVRTILGEAKEHPTEALTLGSDLSWRRPFSLGGREVALSAGAQAERAQLRSKYFDFDTDTLQTDGRSFRTTFSALVGARIALDARTSVRLGFRQDAIRLRSESVQNGLDVPSHTFWLSSPFVAVSRQLGDRVTVYGSYSSAFRVPTLNQLFDRRPFFGSFYLSNPDLRPQKSRGGDLGARLDGSNGGWALLSLYTIRVRDEIDFDAGTNTYANLGRSWHRGIEAGLEEPVGRGINLLGSASYTPTTIRGGSFDGHQINAVPRRQAYGGLRWVGPWELSIEGGAHYVGQQYLDKASQHRLRPFATVDLAASARVPRVRATVRVGNLLNRKYADTGYFVDFLGEERFYPAAGRSFTLSLAAD